MLGLESGADDYISKPFVVEELVARVRAHLRREQRVTHPAEEQVIKVGEIELHIDTYEVFKKGKPVQFSTREFQLLQYLMENKGKVLTREQIFSHVWNTEFGDIGTVAVNIKSVRDKIDPDNTYKAEFNSGFDPWLKTLDYDYTAEENKERFTEDKADYITENLDHDRWSHRLDEDLFARFLEFYDSSL